MSSLAVQVRSEEETMLVNGQLILVVVLRVMEKESLNVSDRSSNTIRGRNNASKGFINVINKI